MAVPANGCAHHRQLVRRGARSRSSHRRRLRRCCRSRSCVRRCRLRTRALEFGGCLPVRIVRRGLGIALLLQPLLLRPALFRLHFGRQPLGHADDGVQELLRLVGVDDHVARSPLGLASGLERQRFVVLRHAERADGFPITLPHAAGVGCRALQPVAGEQETADPRRLLSLHCASR